MAFNIDIFWDILRSAGGANPSTLTDTMNAITKDEDARSDEYFGNVIDQISYNTADYKRLRKFLVDLYSAHKSVARTTADLSDPWSMNNSDLDELFRSFGYDHSVTLSGVDENTLPPKVALMLDLVNLYKVKGTPQALVDVLQYYGLSEVDIFEFFIRLESSTSLIFRGRAIAGTTIQPGILDVPYPEFTTSDPHWFYTEEQILALNALNKINLPSKTPYIGIRPVIDAQGPESSILSRIIQDQYEIYSNGGTLEQNAEVRTTNSITSLLALYLSVLYLFNTYYPTGAPADLFICYDGTDDNYIEIKSNYESLTGQPKTREEILVKLNDYYDQFNRIQPSNFLQNIGDAEALLIIIDPTLKADIDELLTTDPPKDVLSSLINDLSLWVRNNIGFGFINFAYMIDGLSAFFEDLKPVVNFFKPYRARYILLEALQFKNRLFNSLVLEDEFGTIEVEHRIYDFATADGIPCCAITIDSTDVQTICIDSTGSDDLYYQRDTYDCGSEYDLGIATDLPDEMQFDIEDKYHDSLVCVPYDATDAGIIIDNIDVSGDITPFQTPDGNTGEDYVHIQTGGMADWDYDGTFDCIGGQDLCVIRIHDVTGSSSSSSCSVSSSSSSFSFSSSSESVSLIAIARITDVFDERVIDGGGDIRIIDDSSSSSTSSSSTSSSSTSSSSASSSSSSSSTSTSNSSSSTSSSSSSSSSSYSSSSSSSISSSSASAVVSEVNLIGGPNWGGTNPGGWHKDIIGDSGSVNTLFWDGAVPASPNRCVVATICARLDTASNPTQATAVTLGGRTLTKIFEVNVNDRTFTSLYMWTGYLLEADIALMVGATFAVTWSNQPDRGTQFAYSGYENVDQVTPILDFNSNSNLNTTTVTTGSYTYGGSDQPIIIAMCARQNDGLGFNSVGYTTGSSNFQDYGYIENFGAGASLWSSRLESKTFHNVGATENWTATINNSAGMIAGAIVLKSS